MKAIAKLKDDKYYTSPELAKYCVEKTKEIIGKDNITEYIEPSAGTGVFLNYFEKPFSAYDIDPKDKRIIKADWLSLELPYKKGRCTISNPPFSKKDEVLARAFSFNKPFALLMPVNSIQGKKRHKIFNNEIQMLVFDARVDYHTWGNMQEYTRGNHFGSAYFCRDLLPTKLELRNLNKYDRPLID